MAVWARQAILAATDLLRFYSNLGFKSVKNNSEISSELSVGENVLVMPKVSGEWSDLFKQKLKQPRFAEEHQKTIPNHEADVLQQQKHTPGTSIS